MNPHSVQRLPLQRLPLATLIALVFGCAALGVTAATAAPADLGGGYRLVARWPDPNVIAGPGEFSQPYGIDVAPDGTVAVADSGNHRVQIFGPDGQYRTSYRSLPAPLGQLDRPTDVAILGDKLYVADAGLRRIVVLSLADGSLIAEWAGALKEPWSVAVAPDGRSFVTDRALNVIFEFDPAGVQLAQLGRTGSREGEFFGPAGIDIGSNGLLYVADSGNGRVQILNQAGRSQETVVLAKQNAALVDPPEDVAVDPQGNLYVVSNLGLAWLSRGIGGQMYLRQPFPSLGAQGVAVEPRFGIYVVQSVVRSAVAYVSRYNYLDRALAPDLRFGNYGGPVNLQDITRVATAVDGTVGILSAAGVSLHGQDGRFVRFVTGTDGATELAFFANGDLLLADRRSVSRVKPTGVAVWSQTFGLGGPFPIPGLAGNMSWIAALACDLESDHVYAVDVLNGVLIELAGDGTVLAKTSIGDPNAFLMIRDLAVAPNGNLVVVNQTSRQIEFRRPDWSLVRVLVPRGVPARVSVNGDQLFVLTRDGWVWRYDDQLNPVTSWNGAPGNRALDVAGAAEGVYTVDPDRNQVLVWQYDPSALPEPPPTAPESARCRVKVNKAAAPDLVLLGENVDVTLDVGGTCPDIPPQADIVLVIDHSGSMEVDDKMTAAKDAAIAFIGAVDYTQSQVAVVSFSSQANLDQPLTTDAIRLAYAVSQLSAVGGTDIGTAVTVAAAELAGPRRRPTALGVIILLTDGNSDEVGALLAALDAKLDGSRLFSIGLGKDVNANLLTRIASTPTDYYFAPTNTELSRIYTDIARRIRADVLLRSVQVTDELPANMRFVKTLSGPAPSIGGNVLSWSLADVGFAGIRLQYRLQPTAPGVWPTNGRAEAGFLDGLGGQGRAVFPVPYVTVLQPYRVPTPRPPTLTPVPSPTPTPKPRPKLYIPIVSRSLCVASERRVDVMLVVDTSSSMREPTRAGRSKLEAAQAAAMLFVDLLNLPRDQAGVVSFNHAADLVQPLTVNRQILHDRLAGLATDLGTRIDLGIQVGAAELTGPRHRPASNRVLVLLTDGRPTGTTNQDVIAAAAAARRAGLNIFAIGLGTDVDPILLEAMATDATHVFLSPDGDDLERIYRSIAATIPCR